CARHGSRDWYFDVW
nr:immunoglobulin heavy chain junction region [Mus musculus]MBK4197537.1 immunoglobulin heavy chain junction region [Mus musculus]